MTKLWKKKQIIPLVQSEFEKYGAVTDVYNTGKGYVEMLSNSIYFLNFNIPCVDFVHIF